MTKKKNKNITKPKAKQLPHVAGKQALYQKLFMGALLIICFIVFSPSLKYPLLNFDDTAYVTENPLIRNLNMDNLYKIFTEPYYGGYYPLTLLSFGLDLAIAGDNVAQWAHLVNLLLHLANVLLVFLLIFRLGGNFYPAFLTASLFALHPLHVESVAWVTERKDVLYTLFFLLSLLFYLDYLKKNNSQKYWLAVLFFLLSIISKTMAASLVVCLLAIDYYKGRDLLSKKVWLEKIPFLLFAIAFGIMSIQAQKEGGMIVAENHLNLWSKLVFAAFGYFLYVLKLIFPFAQSAFYPFPEVLAWYHYSGIIFVLVVLYLLIRYFKKDKKLVFGILFFSFNIILVLQIVQINNFFIAERFTYIASIGIFFLLALLADRMLDKFTSKRNTVFGFIAVYILFLSLRTYQRQEVWKDSISIWTDMIDRHPDRIPKAYYFRAYAYLNENNAQAALADLNKVIELKPPQYLPMAYQSRATLMANNKEFGKALADINKALEADSTAPAYWIFRARIWTDLGKNKPAIRDFNKAISLKNDDPVAYYYRAMYYTRIKNFEAALEDYETMIKLNPDNGEFYYNRGILKYQLGQKDDACKDFRVAANKGYERAYSVLRSYCGEF